MVKECPLKWGRAKCLSHLGLECADPFNFYRLDFEGIHTQLERGIDSQDFASIRSKGDEVLF